MLIVSRRKLDTFNEPLCLTIDSNSIKQVSFRRFLGVYTDKNLPWNIPISKYLKKVASGIGISRRSTSFVSFKTILCIYHALVQPHSSSYGGIAINLSQLHYKNYRIALRVFWPLLPTMPDLGLGKTWSLTKILQETTDHKLLNAIAPDYLKLMFIDRSEISNYSLRDS